MKMTFARIFGVMGLLMLVLSGCTTVLEGTVVSKTHSDSYIEPYQTCVQYDTDNPGICKMYTTNYRTHPESWGVVIEGANTDGELDTKEYSVSEITWSETNTGDFMRFNEKGHLVEHTQKLR